MIYVYGITEVQAAAPDCTGLDDQPLRVMRLARVAAIISYHELGHLPAEPQTLWRHDRVVEAAMSLAPVLPARFGTTFADCDALAAALAPIQERLALQLDRVRGCVELAVRVSLPTPPAATPQTGSDYLQAKLALARERAAAAERTLRPLEQHAVRAHSGASSTDTATLTASYLVAAGDVERFADQVRRLASRHSDLSLSCTGPWPPYSFVEDGETWAGTLAPGERPLAGSEAS